MLVSFKALAFVAAAWAAPSVVLADQGLAAGDGDHPAAAESGANTNPPLVLPNGNGDHTSINPPLPDNGDGTPHTHPGDGAPHTHPGDGAPHTHPSLPHNGNPNGFNPHPRPPQNGGSHTFSNPPPNKMNATNHPHPRPHNGNGGNPRPRPPQNGGAGHPPAVEGASNPPHPHQDGDGKEHHHFGDGQGQGGNPFADSVPAASTARWLMEQSTWGTVNSIGKNPLMKEDDNDSLVSNTLPFAVSSSEKGRIFFYLMGETHLHGASLTVSQAALTSELFSHAACGSADSAVDPQDPRCGKLTVQGSIHPCNDQHEVGANCEEVGRAALFEKHPSMKDWPEDHDFQVHEFVITKDIWMIANFGGGTPITQEDYATASSVEHNIKEGAKISISPSKEAVPPAWYRHPVRARWIVHHSRWATISTLSIDDKNDDGKDMPFGNIRSIVDGMDWDSSTGTPIFYLPDVDPTAVDMKKHGGQIVLTFSEAALAERVSADGGVCSGQEVGMPTCGQVALYGTVKEYKSTDYEQLFKKFHPLAEWLAEGGSHMPGSYYTIELNRVMILDFFGGFHEVPVEAYLNVVPSEEDVSMKKDISIAAILVAVGFLVGCCCGIKCKKSGRGGNEDYAQIKDLSMETEGESDGSIEMDNFRDEIA